MPGLFYEHQNRSFKGFTERFVGPQCAGNDDGHVIEKQKKRLERRLIQLYQRDSEAIGGGDCSG